MKNRKNDNYQLVSIKDLQRQIGEAKLKLAILQANLEEDNDNAGLEAPALSANQQAAMDRKVLSAIRNEVQRLNKKTRKVHSIPKFLRVAAAVLLVSFISLGTALAVSSQVRVLVMKLLYTVTPQYTEISLVPDTEASFFVPAEWKGEHYPSFIPEGYSFSSVSQSTSTFDAFYFATNDRIMRFTESVPTTEMNTDTEGYTSKEVTLNGRVALLAFREGKTKIIWSMSNRILQLIITEDEQTAIEIAKSVTRVE